MIVGIGSDLANIERIEKTIQKFGGRFLNKVFADSELAEMNLRAKPESRGFACMAAKRFSAKEACSKALGTGFRQGTFWRDIVVAHLPSGKPTLHLFGGAEAHARKLCGEAEMNILLTMTDDYPWAQAFVVIERL